MTKAEKAKLVAILVTLSESLTQMMDILIPDEITEENCPHPPAAIEHEETMDDEVLPWHCRLCGATQTHPFHEE